MRHIARFATGTALIAFFLVPFSASAAGLSFGGRITLLLPCISTTGPAVWVTITPAPATKQPFYIWTAATLRGVPPSSPDPAPVVIGQQILGVADIPYYCCVPPSIPALANTCQIPAWPYWIVVPGLYGQRMQYANQSLAPSTGAEITALLQAAI